LISIRNPFACTTELRRRYFRDDASWRIEEGSALDADYIKSLGLFDVVYSWGVLHHTGQMWKGLENAVLPVAPGGKLFIAIYNDTGTQSARWNWIKRTYNRLPRVARPLFALLAIAPDESKSALRALLKLEPGAYVRSWTNYAQNNRGMSRWHDIIDWVGGYPYEVATPEEIFEFYRKRGFTLTKLKCGKVGLGCNEFVLSGSSLRSRRKKVVGRERSHQTRLATLRHNVLQLIGSFNQGGSERQAVQLTRLLHESGRFNVFVATLDRSGPLAADINRLGISDVPEYKLTSFYDRNAVAQLRRFAGYLKRN
jgi:2-polyprenyl-6-hydroxyphenyl methylase/3-demethylubiquinone-9 3-methyltransferase